MGETARIIHTDQRYINALLQNDTLVIREIYERFSPRLKSYIQKNNGSEDDAADIMQEALVDIYQQAKNRALQLTCPFEAFLLLVCKRKWLNELKKRGQRRVTSDPEQLSNIGEDALALADQLQLEEEKAQLFLAMFKKLGEKCREIIELCLSRRPQEEIAAELGVSYAYLRKKKSECMSALVKSIQSQQTRT